MPVVKDYALCVWERMSESDREYITDLLGEVQAADVGEVMLEPHTKSVVFGLALHAISLLQKRQKEVTNRFATASMN